MSQELTKPWIDLKKYREDRLKEALYEADLAERFMNDGLLRNAAGKAYQAVKAYIAAVAVDYREQLAKYFLGKKRLSKSREVDMVDWVIAVMPSTQLRKVASIIGDKDLLLATEIALNLHEYQYNGLDKGLEISRYDSTEFVKKDILFVVSFIKGRVKEN